MKRAIVLSGGGAKGSYEIGVWKALRKLRIHYDIVTGTSVGALNGIFMVQKSYFRARRVWKRMEFPAIFEESLLEKYHHVETLKDLVYLFGENALKGGVDASNLKKLIHKNLKLKKLMNSPIDFGMITCNVRRMEPVFLTKKEIPKEKIKDYIMASASCYPFFEMMEIDGEYYIDGGFYDNMPINLAIQMGAEEVIAVNLNAPGIIRKVKDKSIPIIYIESKNNIGNFLNFKREQALRGMKLGYNDTMKAFNKLEGTYFTFKKKQLEKHTDKYLDYFLNNNELFLEQGARFTKVLDKRLFGLKKGKEREEFQSIVEETGKILDFDDEKIYSSRTWTSAIKKEMKKEKIVSKNILKEIKKGEITISLPSRKKLVNHFLQIIEMMKEKDSKTKKDYFLQIITFPKEWQIAIYLYTIAE